MTRPDLHAARAAALAVVVLVAAGVTSARASSLEFYTAPRGRLAIDVSAGFLSVDVESNDEGARSDLDPPLNVVPLHLVATYGATHDVDAWIDLSAASLFRDGASGFAVRELVAGLGGLLGRVRVDGGFKADIGTGPEPEGDDEIPSSDGQHGLHLSARTSAAAGSSVRLSAGARLVYSLADDNGFARGLLLDGWLGFRWQASSAIAIGVDLGFARYGESSAGGDSIGGSDAWIAHALPWVELDLADGSELALALAHAGENLTTGYALGHQDSRLRGLHASTLPPITARWSKTF